VSATTRGGGAILSWIRDQDAVIARLRHAVLEERVAQAYLFHGPRGVGKTRTALGLAQALNCEDADRPCGHCLPCRKIASLVHPDVRLLFPTTREEEKDPEEIAKRLEDYGANRYHLLDFARNASIGIDRIRDLKTEAAKSMAEGRRRIFILTDAARMLEEAAQSALKLIEEPPPGTHLILTTEEPSALLPTIVSRCQQVRFRPLHRDTIAEILGTEAEMDAGAARLVATLSNGSLGRALALKEETSIVTARNEAVELIRVRPDSGQIQDRVRSWVGRLDPNSARRNVELLLMWCHDLLALKFGLPDTVLSNPDRRSDLAAQAAQIDLPQIRAWIDALEEMIESIDRNVHPGLTLHETLMRFAGAPGDVRTWEG
jgi:DNA polymerase III subunit delta'